MYKNKFSTIALIICIAAISSCERKSPGSGASNCGTSVNKYMADGKSAYYAYLYSTDATDSALQISYTQLLTSVFQEKRTKIKHFVWGPPVSIPTVNTIPYHTLLCGKDVVVNELAYNIESRVNDANYLIKGSRIAGSTWTHTLNGVKYYMGCAATLQPLIVPVDTFLADKIYIKTVQNAAIADTIYYNDTVGVLLYNGVNSRYWMVSKNY